MKPVLGRAVRTVICLCLTAGLLGGCLWDRPDEAGVVAVVAGSPIRLAELEARHDLGRLGLPQVDNPAVEELRSEYGATLAGLIVARLVHQELDRLKLSLSDQELRDAEEAVRADYPGEAFEAMLLEEHIDLPRWREMLADRLALEKFIQTVLRPNIRVGVSEAANYYKEHRDAFTKPASVRLRLVAGRDAETVKAALAAVRKADPAQADAGMPEVVLPEAGLPPAWREALKARKPGEATAPLASGHEFLGLILVERLPATVLDPAKAYSRVEAMLAAEKLAKAFAAWLAEALAGTTIRVNTRLLARQLPADSPAAPAVEKAEQAELNAARSQEQASGSLAGLVRKSLAEKQADAPAPDQKSMEPATGSPPPAVAEEVPASLVPPVAEESAATLPAAPAAPQPPESAGQPAQAVLPMPPAPAMPQPGQDGVAPATPPIPTPGPDTPGTPVPVGQTVQPESVPAAPPFGSGGGEPRSGPGEVEFTAVKASWILYTVDEGREERVYLKPGKPHRIAYARRLSVRLGSPSEVAYRAGSREETIEVGKKESRVLEFP